MLVALTPGALATGFFGPTDYLSSSQQNLEASPEFYWELEVKRLASAFKPVEKLRVANLESAQTGEEKAPLLLKATGDADLADFAAALQQGRIKPADPAQATLQHQAAREFIAATDDKQTGTLPEEFDSEFAWYHRGAFAYRRGPAHWQEARAAWEVLLNQPPETRHYRTVWAAFMLGKLAMKTGDYPGAIQWFQKTRKLAGSGFADSLGMAADSYGWEGRCEWKANRPEKAAPLFLTQLALGDQSAIVSLKALIPDRLPIDGMLDFTTEEEQHGRLVAAARDPLLRRLVTAHVLATDSGSIYWRPPTERGGRWLAVIKEAAIQKVEEAEYLGWLAYTNGSYAEAQRWLEMANPDTVAACWLRSKLQRRAGDLKAAAQSLQQAWQIILKPGAYTGWTPADPADNRIGFSISGESFGGEDSRSLEGFSFRESASGELGTLRLGRSEFVQALEIFVKGDLRSDAAYIAERVLSADELKAYVDQHPEANLSYLLGRRLVREGRFKEAGAYLKAPYNQLLEVYAKALNEGGNEALPKPKRAEAWLTAAWLARRNGMELMGTEVAPDGFSSQGGFSDPEIARMRQSGVYESVSYNRNGEEQTVQKPMVLPPTREELKRIARNRISPDVRYHYRILAAQHALNGAKLLPDNSEELADVLNTAGLWTKERDEKLANRIYGLIEKRCADTELGKKVLAQHWFIDEKGPWRAAQETAHESLLQSLGFPQ